MNHELRDDFFDRSPIIVAKELVGKILVRKFKGSKARKFLITEAEAYAGEEDLASHARFGRTARNAPMFEEAGTIYVYFTYGMHWLLNIICGPKGHPGGVLIRGITSPPAPLLSKERGVITNIKLDGPAKLTKYLGIDKDLNGKKLGKKSGLWIESSPPKASAHRRKIKRTPRIGIDYAGEIWKNKKWRFVLENITPARVRAPSLITKRGKRRKNKTD